MTCDEQSFSLLFYVKSSKLSADGTAPIYLRITIDGKRIEISSKRQVIPSKWNTAAQKLVGTGDQIRSFNDYLKTLERQVYEVHQLMLEKKIQLTAANLKSILLGKEEATPDKMLIPIFEEHNKQVKALIGKEFAKGTYDRYETSLKHTKDFLLWKYKATDNALPRKLRKTLHICYLRKAAEFSTKSLFYSSMSCMVVLKRKSNVSAI
ncbi:hypothetical protein ABIB62_001213 [Mucilaginibacter sp. UYP25]|uniref:Arm DNA-binding domain-containing protein n=1 Tax=unclassified Mucilaginibacter TaxID=2617802 RepID=UPI003393D6F1